MNGKVVGFLLLVVLGGLVILGIAFIWKPANEKKAQEQATRERVEASGVKIRTEISVRADTFAAYYPATLSKDLVLQLEREGIAHKYIPDDPDYDARIKAMVDGEVQMALMPISSYVLNGAKYKYPGVVVASVSESRGADAIVVRKSAFQKLNVDALDTPGIKIAFTPASPSEDLLILAFDTFDMAHLSPKTTDWRVEVKSSAEALQKLEQGIVPAAVGYEPDITAFLRRNPDDFAVVYSSREFRNAIVDVWVVESKFFTAHHTDLVTFFGAYFGIIEQYQDRDRLIRDMDAAPAINLKADEIDVVLGKLDMHTLGENCREMFGVGTDQHAVADGVLYWRDLYRKLGKLGPNDLRNPGFIVNPSILEQLRNSPLAGVGSGSVKDFKPLDSTQWSKLKEAGNARFAPVEFRSGGQDVTDEEAANLEEVGRKLTTILADNRVIIRGHTKNDNQPLSLERAQAVCNHLVRKFQLDPDRVRAEGMGNSGAKPKRLMVEGKPEPFSMWQARFSRVEVVVMEAEDDV